MNGSERLCLATSAACLAICWSTVATAATGTIQLRTGNEPSAACETSSTPSVSVAVQLADLSDPVNGVQALLAYNASVLSLNISSSTEASGFTRILLSDSGGLITYAIINNGGSVGAGSGPYTVATLVFDVIAEGATSLTFQADSPPLTTRLTTDELNPQIISGASLTKSASGSISIDNTTATAADNGPVCEGTPLTLSGGTTGTLPNPPYSFDWTGPGGFTSDEEDPLVSNSATLAMAGMYTLTVTNGQGCTFQAMTNVTVNPSPVAPDSASSDPSSYCDDAVPGTIELSVTGGSGTTLEWFTGSCGGTSAGTGNPLVIAAPSVTTTYYARWTNGCGSSSCVATTVTVNASPVAPDSASSDPSSYCDDAVPGTIELSVTGGSGTTLEWFTGSCGGTSAGTGNPLVIAAPSVTTTYYARWTNGCGSSSCVATTVTVNTAPTCVILTESPVCAGLTYNADGPAGMSEYEWFVTGGTLESGQNTDQITYTAGSGSTVTIDLTVTDVNGCISSCQQIVDVESCLTVNLEIQGLNGGVAESAHVANRDVRFDITSCSGSLDTRVETVSFVRTGSNGSASVTLRNVDVDAGWLSVVEGHALRRLVPIDLGGDHYDIVDVLLIAGDLQTSTVGQDNLVDIVDFSILASRWETQVSDCVSGNPEDCALGADVTGDGWQNTADFTAIQINFFAVGDLVDECPLLAPPIGDEIRPIDNRRKLGHSRLADRQVLTSLRRTSISTAELLNIDSVAVAADIDGNGVVDGRDMRAFATRHGLPILPEFDRKLRQLEAEAVISKPGGTGR